MADVEDDVPPGFTTAGSGAAPAAAPAAAAPAPAASADAELAASVAGVKVDAGDNAPDAPDLSLRLSDRLVNPETEITSVTADGEENLYASAAHFEDLPLSPELLKGLYAEMKFERPSRIQAKTLPMILTPDAAGVHRDLIAQAHNGSGKTTCFALAMLSRVDPALEHPQALCMCPTRELVLQNLAVVRRMAKYTTIKAVSTADEGGDGGGGGAAGRRVARRAKLTEQVVIGTHGRCKNWVSDRVLDLDGVRILVFDEADEMLKADAFADESVRLIKTARKRNPNLQLLLFSATFNDKVKGFAMRIAPRANMVFVPKESLSLDVIKQYNVHCPTPADKTKVLQEQIFPNCEKLGQTIIFARTRLEAARLHQVMSGLGYKCTSLRGDMQAGDRDAVVNEFREGVTKILIATDVLSRGFDVSQVTLVVNYDVPVEKDGVTPAYDTYLHRIGRSGRFGRKGAAFNLVCGGQDARVMSQIAEYFNRAIPEVAHDDEDGFIGVLNAAGLTDQTA